MTHDRTLTLAEAAELLRVSPRTARRYIESGHLQASRLGPRLIRVHAASVEALLHSPITARPAA